MSHAESVNPTPVQLLRRWVVDYFNSHDRSVAHEFIVPSYALEIGDHVFEGRDTQWLPAVDQQMQAFPGMGMTVHQVISTHDRAAIYFSEHGASNGRMAVWSGVGIYRSNGLQLTGCIAQEDYMTRQRQLKSGVADAVEAPAVSPWDTTPLSVNLAAEAVVRHWLTQSWPLANTSVRCDDELIIGVPLAFKVQSVAITELFSSGDDVAFHARQTGHYIGGFAGIEHSAKSWFLNVNGLLRVQAGQVVSGRIIRDRIGLKARLQQDLKP